MSDAPDLVIVGAGPAGMSAAVTARKYGLSVTVLDQNPGPGGQVYRAIETPGDMEVLGPDYAKGAVLARAFRNSGADYRSGTSVYDIAHDGTIGCIDAEGAWVLRAGRILIASGAMERPVPFPGWTLPGVMTVGAIQTMLKASGLVPDVPVVIAGTGPLTYLLTCQLLAAGAPIAALVDTADPANRARARRHLPAAAAAGKDLWRGLRWLRQIRRSGLRRITGARILRGLGEGRIEGVEVESAGRRETLRCGLLLVHEGVIPSTHLAMAAGCRHRWNDLRAAWETETDEGGRTSVAGIHAAGDGTGIRGAEAAALGGTLAALAISRDLGRIDPVEATGQAAPIKRRLARLARIRRFLDHLYRPRHDVLCPPDAETLVCRCEEVSAGEIRQIAGLGCPGPNQMKSFCRAGMGPCQGRICGAVVGSLLAEVRGKSVSEIGHLRIRPPIKPVTIAQMAGLRGLATDPSFSSGLPTAPEADGS